MSSVMVAAIQPLAHGPDGSVIHPRLLEQDTYRMQSTAAYQSEAA